MSWRMRFDQALFLEERKDIKKMTLRKFELIEASCAWVVDKMPTRRA